jgi:hypothetical protein
MCSANVTNCRCEFEGFSVFLRVRLRYRVMTRMSAQIFPNGHRTDNGEEVFIYFHLGPREERRATAEEGCQRGGHGRHGGAVVVEALAVDVYCERGGGCGRRRWHCCVVATTL